MITTRFLRSDAVVVGLLLLAALAFRLPQIHDSLWLDELHTGWTIQEDVQQVAERARMGNNHPTYFYLPYATTRLFGDTEFAIRLPSLLAGLAAIFTGYCLVRYWTQSIASAATSAGLLVIDPHFLFYALEARPYALIQWLGLIHAALFVNWMVRSRDDAPDSQQPRWLAVAWTVTAALLFYLHYTSILLLLVELPIALFWLTNRQENRRFLIAWCAFLGLTCFAIPSVLDIYSRRTAWTEFIAIPRVANLWTVFPLTPYLGPTVLMWFASLFLKRPDDGETDREIVPHRVRELLLIGLLFALPVLLAFAITRMDIARLFLRRYLIVVSGLPMLFVGLLIGRIGWQRFRVAAACVVLIVAACFVGPFVEWRYDGRFVRRSREDWKAAVAAVKAEAEENDVVYVASDLIESDLLTGEENSALFESYCALPMTGFYDHAGQESRKKLRIIPLPMKGCAEYVADKQLPPPQWIVTRRDNANRLDRLIPKGATKSVVQERLPTVVRVD